MSNTTKEITEGGWCSDPLIDLQLSWDTQDPDISVCLQKTVLVWAPCGFLWLLAPIQANEYLRKSFFWHAWIRIKGWRIYKTEGKSISYSLLNILRLVLAGGVGLLALGDLGYWSTRDHDTVDILDPVLRALTMLLVIVIIQGERLKGFRSSGLLWVFWSILLLSSIPRLYSQIRREYLYPSLHRN